MIRVLLASAEAAAMRSALHWPVMNRWLTRGAEQYAASSTPKQPVRLEYLSPAEKFHYNPQASLNAAIEWMMIFGGIGPADARAAVSGSTPSVLSLAFPA
jgi:hypothetical protein